REYTNVMAKATKSPHLRAVTATPPASPAPPDERAVARPRVRVLPTPEPRTMSLSFLAEPAPRNRLLMWAIIGSIFLHAVVLAIRFAPTDLSKSERDAPPLESARVH